MQVIRHFITAKKLFLFDYPLLLHEIKCLYKQLKEKKNSTFLMVHGVINFYCVPKYCIIAIRKNDFFSNESVYNISESEDLLSSITVAIMVSYGVKKSLFFLSVYLLFLKWDALTFRMTINI